LPILSLLSLSAKKSFFSDFGWWFCYPFVTRA